MCQCSACCISLLAERCSPWSVSGTEVLLALCAGPGGPHRVAGAAHGSQAAAAPSSRRLTATSDFTVTGKLTFGTNFNFFDPNNNFVPDACSDGAQCGNKNGFQVGCSLMRQSNTTQQCARLTTGWSCCRIMLHQATHCLMQGATRCLRTVCYHKLLAAALAVLRQHSVCAHCCTCICSLSFT
jgi:hypothetical protein